jgi:hypothetical protein
MEKPLQRLLEDAPAAAIRLVAAIVLVAALRIVGPDRPTLLRDPPSPDATSESQRLERFVDDSSVTAYRGGAQRELYFSIHPQVSFPERASTTS